MGGVEPTRSQDGRQTERTSRGADRPGLDPARLFTARIPFDWPEAVTFRAGDRLLLAGADEVPFLVRSGLPIVHYLTPDEIEAQAILGLSTWERWFRLGWTRAADDEGW